MFVCPLRFVTKQRSGIDIYLDILILLDLVFIEQVGSQFLQLSVVDNCYCNDKVSTVKSA